MGSDRSGVDDAGHSFKASDNLEGVMALCVQGGHHGVDVCG
jgi:hypothetical protein